MPLTIEQLRAISPRMGKNPLTSISLLPVLTQALEWGQINTRLRIAAFMGECLWESGEFRYMQEIWGPTPQQLLYEPPSALATQLGNIYPGDGSKYRGHGVLQITGRYNHTVCGKAIGVDLVNHPEIAGTPTAAFLTGAWFWQVKKLNQLADVQNFREITHRVNGGYSHEIEREAFYNRALQVLT